MSGETVLVIDDSPTILKVVQLVLTKAGYTVHTAENGEEGIAVARETAPQVIILDFVMPKMNGYQVCQALQEEPGLGEIPVILMSAKGDQVGERFVKVMGIVDYITKPFSPEAITGVVRHTLDKYGDAGEMDDEDTLEPEIRVTAQEAAQSSQQRRREALAELWQGLSSLAAEAAARSTPEGEEELDPEQVAGRIAAAPLLEELELLLGRMRTAAPLIGGGVEPSLYGDLAAVPLAEVLQLLSEQEQSGELLVSQGEAQVELYFRSGRIQLGRALGVSDEFLLGRFMVENELLSQEELDLALQERGESPPLLGAYLVEQEQITVDELKEMLKLQTQEQVYELMRWKRGHFAFYTRPEIFPVAQEASLELDVETILMEGFRRVDEWHLIEREIDNFEQVFLRNEDAVARMGRGRLTREELAVLELVNGKNTVKEIVRQSRMGSFDVSKMLYRLLSIKLIRRRVQPLAV